jgi:hypothetical protein
MGTKNNPGKFDCFAAAEPDEPFFTLLGRDPCAPFVIAFWVEMRKAMGKTSEEKLAEADRCADEMARWAGSKGKDIVAAAKAMRAAIEASARELERVMPVAGSVLRDPGPDDAVDDEPSGGPYSGT